MGGCKETEPSESACCVILVLFIAWLCVRSNPSGGHIHSQYGNFAAFAQILCKMTEPIAQPSPSGNPNL